MQNVNTDVLMGVSLFVDLFQAAESADTPLRGFLGAPPLSHM